MALKTSFGIVGLALALAGCVSATPELVHFNMPGGKKATAVVHDQQGPTFLNAFDSSSWYINYVVRGDAPTAEQQAFVAETERGCRIVARKEQPNPFVSIGANALVYGSLGTLYGPVTGALNKAFSHSQDVNSTAVGTSDFLGGAGNGLITVGGVTYSFENCGKALLESVFPESHVTVLEKMPY